MHYEFLLLICSYLLFDKDLAFAEIFVNYNVRLKTCPEKNLYSCSIRRERICKAERGTTKVLCSRGVFYEEFKDCSQYELSKDYCSGGYEFEQILQSCEGKCRGRREKVQFRCKSNPSCSKVVHRHCSCSGTVGAWCQWSSYSECPTTCEGGAKTRVRYKCRDPSDGTISSDCGTISCNETDTSQCNTQSCRWTTPPFVSSTTPTTTTATTSTTTTTRATTTATTTTTTTVPNPVSEKYIVPVCESSCGATHNDNLDISIACANCFICNSNKNIILSCDKNPTCRRAMSPACPVYRKWSDWSEWNATSPPHRRHRYQLCHHSAIGYQNLCHREAILQTECRTKTEPIPQEQRWIIWLIIGVALVILLLCCCGVTCYCFGKNQRRNKTIAHSHAHAVTGPDDVFIQTGGTRESAQSNKLGIINRLERISEHMYEAISGQSSRLLSRISTASSTRRSANKGKRSETGQRLRSTDKVENEYTGDEDVNGDNEGITFRQRDISQQQSRVSVLITDPDGIEVFNDSHRKSMKSTSHTTSSLLSAPNTHPIDYVEMKKSPQKNASQENLSSSRGQKTQWDRIPSPPSREIPQPKFFQGYHNENDADPLQSALADLEMTASQATFLTSLDDGDWPAADNVSVWSDSSFESANYSDSDVNEQLTSDRRSCQSSRKKSRTSAFPQNLDHIAPKANKNVGYLAPGNVPVVQYLSPRPANPVLKKLKAPSEDGNCEKPGIYLKMNSDRATVKSWLNLGVAPAPENKTDSGYCDANELNQTPNRDLKLKKLSREQSLDEKYTSAPYPRPAIQDNSHAIPHDTEGYFNVNFPEPSPRRQK